MDATIEITEGPLRSGSGCQKSLQGEGNMSGLEEAGRLNGIVMFKPCSRPEGKAGSTFA